MTEIKMSRAWAMPNSNTFSIKPIKELIEISRDDFEKDATNNGEREVFEVLKNATFFELAGTLE